MGQQRNQRGNKKYLQTNENSNMTFQKSKGPKKKKKSVLRGNFIVIQAYITKQEKI